VRGSEFNELEFFRAIAEAGVRALSIGRQTLVPLGLPVLAADCDFWIQANDIEAFNAACEYPSGLARVP
jgi:hypothetical protein